MKAIDDTTEPRAGERARGGRPRDGRIDVEVMRVTAELLVEVGYSRLSTAAVAQRAGTTKPAIYRRWPSKAHLVHEVVFPDDDEVLVPDTGDLAADLTSMVRAAAELFGRPLVRAALPGLMAEFTADPALHQAMLERFSQRVWASMHERLRHAAAQGQLRGDVDAGAVLEILGGSAMLAVLVRPGGRLDEDWIQSTARVLLDGVLT